MSKKTINAKVSEDAYWKFQQLKVDYKAENNGDLVEKLIENG